MARVLINCLVGSQVDIRSQLFDLAGRPVTPTSIEVVAGLISRTPTRVEASVEEGLVVFAINPDEPGTWGYKVTVTAPVRVVSEGIIQVEPSVFEGGG